MLYPVRRIWNPALYQGGRVSRRYFEGWYFKQVNAAGSAAVIVIPGVSYSADGTESHAFVQVLSGGGMSARYFAYPIEAFSFERGPGFGVQIGENRFSEHGMTLHLADDAGEVHGELEFGKWSPWPVRPLSPGIMGWYRFVPRMEVYHAVLSMDHDVRGSITIGDQTVDFTDGRGYIEKDWGRSFPGAWIWAQTNTFDRPGVSLAVSVAKIPWMRGSFVGHIAGLLLDGTLHRFATYTGARVLCLDERDGVAHLVVRGRREELDLTIRSREAAVLKAPVLGAMEGRDAESLGGTIEVILREPHGGATHDIFRGVGRQAAIELMDPGGELPPKGCEQAGVY